MTEKICLFCKYFDWEGVGVGADYSEQTGGDTYGGMSCFKGRYRDYRPDETEDFREKLLTAKDCPDYEPPK